MYYLRNQFIQIKQPYFEEVAEIDTHKKIGWKVEKYTHMLDI